MSKTFANSINNNPLYAERAEQDASGNVITTTYATKSEVSAVDEVPAVTSSDNGKVLKATYEGGAGSYAWSNETGNTYTAGDGIDLTNNVISADVDGTTIGIDSSTKKIKLLSEIPTVDQTYNASSTNAQSGTAVASAIAAVPTKPLVAGSNITITENTNNVTIAATVPTVDEVPAVTSSDDGKVLKASYSGGSGSYAWAAESGGATYTAGDGVSISNQNVISAKVDGITIQVNSQTGELEAVSGGSVTEIFWVTPNVTTFSEIWDAANSGKSPIIKFYAHDAYGDSWASYTYYVLQLIENNTTPSSAVAYFTHREWVDWTGDTYQDSYYKDTLYRVDGTNTWSITNRRGSLPNPKSAGAPRYSNGCVLTLVSTGTGMSDNDWYPDWKPAPVPNAGDGITISSNTIAADVDGTTIGIDATTKKIKLLSTIPTVDQTYNASSTNAQSGTAVAEAIAAISVDEVPAVTSSDDGKVLKATYSGGVGSYAWATPSGGGASGDQYVYHAPAHSIIFCFEDTSYNPTTDSNVSSLGTWAQLSSGSNIWQLTMSTGSWADKFYNVGTGSTKLSQRCEILSIDFTGVTSLQTFMKGAQITRIREIRSSIECSADGAFQGTTELRGHVEFPALHGTTFANMFKNSGIDSIRINSLYESLSPGYEGDPEMGEMGADDWYEGATCSSMFYDCTRLRNVEIYGAHVDACASMFRGCDNLTEIPCMESWEFCGGSFSEMFYGCRSLIWVPNISCYHPSYQGSMNEYTNGGSTDYMFYGCISLQSIPVFSGRFGECYSTRFMFFNCSSLISIKWENISELGYYTYMEWDEEMQTESEVITYVVQNVSQMFQNCGNVIHGAVGVYQGMTNYWHQISQHGGTFSNCGTDVGSTERSSIPTSWGGTGA